jgi:hypothetical protein
VRRFFQLLALAGLLVAVTSSAAAQRRSSGGGLLAGPIEIGIRGGRDFENHAWTLGGQVRVPLKRNFELRPSGDFLFPEDAGTGWQVNADAALLFGSGGVYGGGGAAWLHPEGGTTYTGYNLFFGIQSVTTRFKPFLEFRWTFINDTSPFRLMLGFSLPL